MSKSGSNRMSDIAARNPTGALVGLLVSAVVLAGVAAPYVLRFRSIGVQDLTALLTPAFMAALFIERVIEVFVSIARGADRRRLKLASESVDGTAAAREELAAFRSKTQSVALIFGVTLGLVLAVLGLRVVEPLVDGGALAAVHAWQQRAFRMFDVVVTGGLIGGGADGIHKLVSVFTTKFDQLADANREKQERTGAR